MTLIVLVLVGALASILITVSTTDAVEMSDLIKSIDNEWEEWEALNGKILLLLLAVSP